MRHALASVLALVLALVPAAWPGAARASAGPESLQPLASAVQAMAGAELQLRGQGRLRFLGLGVYDASLWTARDFRASRFDAHPFVLELTYLRDFADTDIARASLEQMRRHGAFDEAQAGRWQAQLVEALPSVRKGERLAGVHRPGRGVSFFHQGQPVGEVADPQFARLFFAIWLGEATSAPALRQALLAGVAP